MRSLNALTILGLMTVGWMLCAANIWYSAARSTIPLALHGRITQKRLGIEKHPGVDDAPLITLDNTATLQIDRALFEQLTVGDWVAKNGWDSALRVNDQPVRLVWSQDFWGLLWCNAAAAFILLIASLLPSRSKGIDQNST